MAVAARFQTGLWIPVLPMQGASNFTFALSTAAAWHAHGFIVPEGKTLSKFKCWISAVAGSLGVNDVTCSLYSAAATTNIPGTLIETSNTLTAPIAAGAFVEFTGFTTVLSAGVQYYMVIKNVNVAPSTNFPTVQITLGWGVNIMGTSGPLGFGRGTTANSGGTWTITSTNIFGSRWEFSDGSALGFPTTSFTGNPAADPDIVYSTHEITNKFTTGNYWMVIRGCSFVMTKTGTPTGTARARLYFGSSPVLQATGLTLIPSGIPTASGVWAPMIFAPAIAVPPQTIVRIGIGETAQSDTSSNCFSLTKAILDNNAGSKAALPFGGIAKSTFDGASWTDLDTEMYSMALLLDSYGEVESVARLHGALSGGMRG